jgi:hypothetical protein
MLFYDETLIPWLHIDEKNKRTHTNFRMVAQL